MKFKYSKFRLKGRPIIVKAEYELNSNFNESEEPKIDISCENIIKKSTKNASVKLIIGICNSEPIRKDKPFRIKVEIDGVFEWDEGLNEDEIIRYLNINAPALLYGYVRSNIAYMTNEMGVTPLNIPMMDFTDVKS